MLYKNAYLNVKEMDSDPFFKEEIPDSFDEIKLYQYLYLVPIEVTSLRCLNSEGKVSPKQGEIVS